ncbi:MAG TPA: recombinase [Acetobacteraceae bacterium]|jgi:adenosylcobalamin-dependent ribonucleoside-triphosphate reductase|nr:recombinase [Acetobacteraceae bacterium]
MDGFRASVLRTPGAAFGEAPLAARTLDAGMGIAVARRTVFRPEDQEDFGRVAERVASGNLSLGPAPDSAAALLEHAYLRNAIATGALLTSGRHLQHGDADQAGRNMEVFTNCASAIASFAKFYLLLNGSGVGRAYDDELMAVDWAKAPQLYFQLSASHPDFPDMARECEQSPESLLRPAPADALRHVIADSREGWAEAVELVEAMAFAGSADRAVLLDFSQIRASGSPIRGMQNRPASGPLSLLRAFARIREMIATAQTAPGLALWEQAMLVDHHLSVEVQVGGARRAARMATKSWHDPDILRFIRAKTEGGQWTANNSVMVDRAFWSGVRAGEPRALAIFNEATACAWINGEPGFINADKLEDHRTGTAWQKPVYEDGRDFRGSRYHCGPAAPLLAELSRRAAVARYPVTTNPCGEIALHVTGGYCVIADFAPLLACPLPLDSFDPGAAPDGAVAQWDARVEDAVRLGVRFLLRANRMDALYGEEVKRTNRIGIGPTGLHEWAWMRFGLAFRDLLDDAKAAPFWAMLDHLSATAKQEASRYAAELGQNEPVTVTTIKPAGTTSKLFGLTEGAHLPARRHYLRWVQFKGTRDAEGAWLPGSDPLLAQYAALGYPLRALNSFPGMTIVGFPTVPLIERLGVGEQGVTAYEASPSEQYHWLRLLERHWIGAERGNQISYTLKIFTDRHELEDFRAIVLAEQSRVRCCAILPSRPEHSLGYEYLPEEEISADAFAAIIAGITDRAADEAIDMERLRCESGVCPI